MSSVVTKQLSKALSPYIQHQESQLFIYGTQGYGLYVLCEEVFDPLGNLVTSNILSRRRQDLGDHPRTTALQALTSYLEPFLPYRCKSLFMSLPLSEFWDGSKGRTSYAIHGSSLDEDLLAKAIHRYNASREAIEERRQLAWVRYSHLPKNKMSEAVVDFFRRIRPTRWDVQA